MFFAFLTHVCPIRNRSVRAREQIRGAHFSRLVVSSASSLCSSIRASIVITCAYSIVANSQFSRVPLKAPLDTGIWRVHRYTFAIWFRIRAASPIGHDRSAIYMFIGRREVRSFAPDDSCWNLRPPIPSAKGREVPSALLRSPRSGGRENAKQALGST